MNIAAVVFTICIMLGGPCQLVEDARVTVYIPTRGDSLNCEPPCNETASGRLVDYGISAACGPSIPFDTAIYVDGLGWWRCDDRGGGIGDEDVDLAARETDWWVGMSGWYDVVFVGGNDDD